MVDVMTAVAQVLALENGAQFHVNQGVAGATNNPVLVQVGKELEGRLASIGIALLSVRLEGETLVATIDESEAEHELCPNALRGVVREIAYRLCRQVWDARMEEAPTAPTLVPAA